MASKYSYQLTQTAENDLDNIVSYIAVELANKEAASNFIEKLLDCIQETCLFPESGSVIINEFIPDFGVRKKLINNYVMYYLPNPDKKIITILRIVYGKRNMDEIFRQLKKGVII